MPVRDRPCNEFPGSDMSEAEATISKGRSYEEIGEFWDFHDAGEVWDQTKPAEFEVELKSERLSHHDQEDAS